MSALDLPGGIIGSASKLTEKKIELSLELLKIFYANKGTPTNLDQIVQDYFYIFDGVKKTIPPEQATLFMKRHKYSILLVLGILLIGSFALVPSFLKYGLPFLAK